MAKLSKRQGGALSAIIAAIIAGVVYVEGGYVNHPSDPGGETNHGITKKVAVEHGYTAPMRDMTRDEAIDIYSESFVYKPKYDLIVALSTAVGEELIDSGVNAGPGRSSRWFQTSLNMLNRNGQDCPNITVDGAVGPRTAEAYSCLQRVRGIKKTCEMVLKLMDAQQAAHYVSLAQSDPKFKSFMVGWVDHRIGNVDPGTC